MPNYSRNELKRKARKLYIELIAIYGLIGGARVIKYLSTKFKKERLRRKELERQEKIKHKHLKQKKHKK